jgi:hypothetical protein
LNLKEIANGLTKYRLSLEIAFASGLGSFALNYHNLYLINSMNTPYVLSSIAQGLASLMALLFVIVFFLCQSTGSVSILSQILNPDGYIFLGVFLLSILFPLFALRIVYIEVLADISIGLATLCFFMLFPFINTVNSKVKDSGIRNYLVEIDGLKPDYHKRRFSEIFEDLKGIPTQEIVNLLTVSSIEFFINKFRNFTQFLIDSEKRKDCIRMLSQIIAQAYIIKDSEDIVLLSLDIIYGNRFNSWKRGSLEGFVLPIVGMSVFFDELHGKKNLSKEIKLEVAKRIIKTAFLIYCKIDDKKENQFDYKRKFESVLNLIKQTHKKGHLSWKDMEEGLELVDAEGIEAERKKKFKTFLKKELKNKGKRTD